MASTSSSSSVPNLSKYDVFLSFRGEDTRHSFTDHLYKALLQAGIRTFRDNDSIGRGQDLKPEIEKAIRESRASIIVLSTNYANSRWCLDELVLIMDQRHQFNHFVLPVFYRVNPSDVRNQRGSFAIKQSKKRKFYHVDPSHVRNQQESFVIEAEDGVEGSKWTEANVNRWKATLTEVANLTGMVLSGSETKFIAKVVDTMDSKLDLKLVSTPAHLTGTETQARVINSWIENEQSSDNFLAICGMGGGGKTTLAQHIYNSNRHKFESGSFLQDIGRDQKHPNDLLRLQKQLLSDISGAKKIKISNVGAGTHKIEEALEKTKVLIILDDIVEDNELAALLGTKAFHTQSKIIITTRRLNIDAWFGSISRRCRVHKLELLKDHESLELLSFHAFGSKVPMEGFEALAVELAWYCEGNPLALKVLGSSLFVSAEDPHDRNSMIENWTSTMNSLSSFKGDPDSKIQDVLQKSFESLRHGSHKELFLHIACFFVGEYEEHVVTILEDDYPAKSGIMALINRCLLTVSANGCLVMHQLLQDMGRKIVCEESKDPAKRSRVWNSDESYSVLTERDVRPFSGVFLSHLFFTQPFKGSDTIEGLALDTQKLKKGTKALAINADSLSMINKLKFLRLKGVQVTGSYKKLPELRCLWWHGSHLKRIPLGLCKNNLVALYMVEGKLENFEPPTVFNSLKILDLSFSSNLVSIRSFHRLPKLQALFLNDCSSLTEVSKTIGDLESLSRLNMKRCQNLQKAPSTKKLQVLDLTACSKLKSIPCLPSTLEELFTDDCKLLEKITFQSARFTLQKFVYNGCYLLSEIQGLFKLVPIAELDEADFRHVKWIKAYEDHKVKLVGDIITRISIQKFQMLYEYGIRSTFLKDINDQRMTTSEYTSTSPSFLSFHVPICPDKRRIHGLNVTVLYRSSHEYRWQGLFLQISNKTKGLSWIYNPVVFGKPRVDEDVVWLSYWPIGNILDAGDEVYVEIGWLGSAVISGCGASLVYMDEGEEVENMESNEEVIGGDLSEFEVKKDCYYLCRRDYFRTSTSYNLKKMFNDTTIDYPESKGWRKYRKLVERPVLHHSSKESRLRLLNLSKDTSLSLRMFNLSKDWRLSDSLKDTGLRLFNSLKDSSTLYNYQRAEDLISIKDF